MKITALLWMTLALSAFANPYPDEKAVPKDGPLRGTNVVSHPVSWKSLQKRAIGVLRVEVQWENERFRLGHVLREASGTSALIRRSVRRNPLGSYQGVLRDPQSGVEIAFDSIGTGSEFRRLSRAMTFRFPLMSRRVEFRMYAENPQTGVQEEVVREFIDPLRTPWLVDDSSRFDLRQIQKASVTPEIIVNIYAEGYRSSDKDQFWMDAEKAVRALNQSQFPGANRMTFYGVFAPSNKELGSAQTLGSTAMEYDSLLGLYYPYWNKFGRWYHVVYPTRENKYRSVLGQFPYDYPLIIVNSSRYWGVGNFNELTAIPSSHSSFTYLLLHEFGHFFGLNEEYESGGKTELAFAEGIDEPWSQNITFLEDPSSLKWKQFVGSTLPIPTPDSHWHGSGPIGAYKGGYAQTPPLGESHKPGHSCVMSSGGDFCQVCRHAIEAKIKFDLGE